MTSKKKKKQDKKLWAKQEAKKQKKQQEAQKAAEEKRKAEQEQQKQTTEQANSMISVFSQNSLNSIMSFGKASLSAASGFEKSMSKIQYSTGATNQQMLATREISKHLFAQNAGKDFEEIGSAIMQTSEVTGQQGAALEHTTKTALLLKEAFGVEVSDSVQTADTLMKKFGITSDQAFGLIASGQENTANVSQSMLQQATQALAEVGNLKLSGPGEAMETLKKQMTANVLIPVGEKLLPLMESLGKWVNSHEPLIRQFGAALADNVGQAVQVVSSWLQTAVPYLDVFSGKIVEVWQHVSHWSGFVPLITGIVAALGAFKLIITVVTMATKAWGVASLLLQANPVFLIISAVIGLGVALVVAYQRCETFRNIVNGVWLSIKAGVSAVLGFFTTTIPSWFNGIISGISGLVSAISGWILGIWTTLKNGVIAIFNWILNFEITVWTTIWHTLIGIVGGITGFLSSSWSSVVTGIQNAFSGVGSFFTGIWDGIQATFVKGINWVIDRINSFTGILNGFLGSKWMKKLDIDVFIPTLDHIGDDSKGAKGGGAAGGGHGGTTAVAGSFATGLSYVPYNGFIAELHKGERVLTAEENKNYYGSGNTGALAQPVRAGAASAPGGGGQMNINLTVDVKGGSMNTAQASDLMQQFRKAMQQVFLETMRRGGIEGAS